MNELGELVERRGMPTQEAAVMEAGALLADGYYVKVSKQEDAPRRRAWLLEAWRPAAVAFVEAGDPCIELPALVPTSVGGNGGE